MSPRMTDEYSEFRRRQIVTAAWECFADKGYHETTIRDIAGKLRLSTGIVYCYFKGKADILKAVQECGRAGTAEMLAGIAREKTARGAVQKFIRAAALQTPAELRNRNARSAIGLWAEAMKKPGYRRIYAKQYEQAERTLSRIISEGVQRGELQGEVDPGAFAAFLMALISGMQVQSVLNDIRDPGRYCEDITAFVLGQAWR